MVMALQVAQVVVALHHQGQLVQVAHLLKQAQVEQDTEIVVVQPQALQARSQEPVVVVLVR
jgi:hypothetical protein